jgi:hypothetical protein
MGLVSPTQVSDGSTADSSDINTPINQIAAVVNGNIDNSNIAAAAAIDGSKLANNSIDVGAKASVFDGWIAVSDTWTYASATTVTVPSDATTKYSVGDKVKFTNSGTKYFYITAVGATTLTLNGGSDYTVANAAITVPYYSKAETPLGFPQYFNYTPTFANTTTGSATIAGRFTMSGKMVNARVSWIFGAGSAVGTTPTFTLPVTASSTAYTIDSANGDYIGTCLLLDSGVAGYSGLIKIQSTTVGQFSVGIASGAYLTLGGLTSTIPFTWAASDRISAWVTYESA